MALTRVPAALTVAGVLLSLGSRPAPAEVPATRDQLRAAATDGSADAAYMLGLDYDVGSGGAADPAEALRWYRKAAESGVPAAEFNVAVMLDGGSGEERDPAGAALWYARAAAHGYERAAYDLGQLYAAGDGVPRNPATAEAWFRAAATLPAASRRLVSLKAETSGASAVGGADAALVPPQALNPGDHDTLPPRVPAEVELVWTAPPQPTPVRYFVEVLALGAGTPRRLFAAFTETTAILARLDEAAHSYAWRVYTVDAPQGRYAASSWARFVTRPTAAGG